MEKETVLLSFSYERKQICINIAMSVGNNEKETVLLSFSYE